jgi:integrase/recombinase XerC/integrase/recombinase XerD
LSRIESQRDYALIYLMLSAGLRVSEVVSLTWDQLKAQDDKWLLVDVPRKHHRIQTIRINADAATSMLALNDGSSPFIFTNHRNRQLTTEGVRHILKKYTGVSPHDLRRSFANLVKDKVTMPELQQQLGHANLNTTQRYLETMNAADNSTVEKVGI